MLSHTHHSIYIITVLTALSSAGRLITIIFYKFEVATAHTRKYVRKHLLAVDSFQRPRNYTPTLIFCVRFCIYIYPVPHTTTNLRSLRFLFD